jgi:DNA-binding transcriptional LysR family regulator
MDLLGSIKAFIDTADLGGFSAVSRHTDVSVSTIARQVKALEDYLGIRLINRTTRSQSLTEAGQLYYSYTHRLIHDLDVAKKDVLSFRTEVKGLLRVTLRVSTGTTILPAIPRFLESYPDLTLDLSLTDERLDLVSNGIDVAVWLGELEDSSLIARRLNASKRVICGSPDYIAKHGLPIVPSDLADHNCLVFKASHYRNVWTFVKDGERIEVPVHGNLRSDSGPILLAEAMSGLGLVLLQEFSVKPALLDGKLVRVLEDYQVSPREEDGDLFAVYPHSRGLSRNSKAFVDFLIDLFSSLRRNEN